MIIEKIEYAPLPPKFPPEPPFPPPKLPLPPPKAGGPYWFDGPLPPDPPPFPLPGTFPPGGKYEFTGASGFARARAKTPRATVSCKQNS